MCVCEESLTSVLGKFLYWVGGGGGGRRVAHHSVLGKFLTLGGEGASHSSLCSR